MARSTLAWLVSSLFLCSGVGLASARSPSRAPSRAERPVFQGRRAPSRTEMVKRLHVKRRRGTADSRKTRDGRREGPEPTATHIVNPRQARSGSGQLAYTFARATRWHHGGIYLADGPSNRLDLKLDGVGGQHVLMTCELTTKQDGMALVVSRPGGPTQKHTFDKVGHRYVTFNIANAPASTKVSLHMEDLPGPTSGTKWMVYGCRMEMA